MPFVEPGGEIGAGLPSASMMVEPDKILQLKKRLEDRRAVLRDYRLTKQRSAFSGRPPGSDPCSEMFARGLTSNGEDALAAMNGFIDALGEVIDRLQETAVAYGLVEDANVDRFRRGPA